MESVPVFRSNLDARYSICFLFLPDFVLFPLRSLTDLFLLVQTAFSPFTSWSLVSQGAGRWDHMDLQECSHPIADLEAANCRRRAAGVSTCLVFAKIADIELRSPLLWVVQGQNTPQSILSVLWTSLQQLRTRIRYYSRVQ